MKEKKKKQSDNFQQFPLKSKIPKLTQPLPRVPLFLHLSKYLPQTSVRLHDQGLEINKDRD